MKRFSNKWFFTIQGASQHRCFVVDCPHPKKINTHLIYSTAIRTYVQAEEQEGHLRTAVMILKCLLVNLVILSEVFFVAATSAASQNKSQSSVFR